MSHVFINDKIFEAELFNVSTQSRDISGQITFRLKENYLSWFDPYLYYNPEDHSQVYKMYEYLKKEKSLNIILGDYKENYKP
jgi:hypothetical protein